VALRFPAIAPFDVVALTSEQIRARAPHELAKAETLDYRTMMPEPGGLFDPKVFGPGTVIDAPLPRDDDMIRPRKTQFARIPLAVPMVHPLLLARTAEQIGELAGVTADDVAKAATDLDANRALVTKLESEHAWAVMREVPVLPPDLRPLRLDEHMRWAMTPINIWYQRIFARNARIKKLVEQGEPSAQLANDWAELVAALQGLAENDETPDPVLDPDGDPMPSLRTLAGHSTTHYGTLKDMFEQGASLGVDVPPPRSSIAEMRPEAGEMPAVSRMSTTNMAAQDLVLAKHYIARVVLFALGFEVVPKQS
jgi:DNA-directed RNA polymerase beta' subunit